MAFSFIASVSKQGGANAAGTTSAIDTTGADLIVIAVSGFHGTTPALADSQSNTWTPLTACSDAASGYCQLFYCQAPTTSASHTFSITGTGTYGNIAVAAYSGSAASPLDQQSGTDYPSSTAYSSAAAGSVTTTQNGELIVFAVGDSINATPGVSAATLDESFNLVPGTSFGLALAHYIQPAAGAINPTFTFGSNSGPLEVVAATFKAAGGGAPSTTTILPNDAGIVYSPYNWDVGSRAAVTPNPGAYFKTLFTGNSCALNFDAGNMTSPPSQIWWRIDYGTWSKANVAATVTLTIPSDTLGSADIPYHLLEVVFKSFYENGDDWNAGSDSGVVKLTGITLDDGCAVSAPARTPHNILVLGDSITAGYKTAGESAADSTGWNDARQSWAYLLGENLGAEIGVVGFDGQAYAHAGGSNVPALTGTWDHIYSGVSRSLSPEPDLIVINAGINDAYWGTSGATLQSAAQSVINGLLAATSTAKIVALEALPNFYSGWSALWPYIQAAVTAAGSPRVTAQAVGSIFDPSYGVDSANVHPSGANNQARIAPQVAALLKPYLAGGGAPAAGGFVIGG